MRKLTLDQRTIESPAIPLNKQFRKQTTIASTHQRLSQARTMAWLAKMSGRGERHLPKDKLVPLKQDYAKLGSSVMGRPGVASTLSEKIEQMLKRRRQGKRRVMPAPIGSYGGLDKIAKQETIEESLTVSVEIKKRFNWSNQVIEEHEQFSETFQHRRNRSLCIGQVQNLNAARKPRKRILRNSGVKEGKKTPAIVTRLLKLTERIYKFCFYYLRLKAFARRFSCHRRQTIEKMFENFEAIVAGTVKHLSMELYVPLRYYRDLIKDYMLHPNRYYNKECINFIIWLLVWLKGIGLPSGLMKLLQHISVNRGFVPQGLLTSFELSRLRLSENFGFLKAQTLEQETKVSKMIIGHVLYCRILLHRLLMAPWSIPTYDSATAGKVPKGNSKNSNPIRREDYPKYRAVVEDIASGFYSIFMHYCNKHLTVVTDKRSKTVRKRMNYYAASPLPSCPEQFRVSERKGPPMKGLFPQFSSSYHRRLNKIDDEWVDEMRGEMSNLLQRIFAKIKSRQHK